MSSNIYWNFKKEGWTCIICSSFQQIQDNNQNNFTNLPFSSVSNDNDNLLNNTININVDVNICSSENENAVDYTKLVNGKGLKICHININSIRSKIADIRHFLFSVSPHIFICTESKLEKNRDLSSTYETVGYNFLRFDRDKNNSDFVHGGGTIVFFKEELNIDIVKVSFDIPRNCECNIFKVVLKGSKPIIVTAVYFHPKQPKSIFVEFFKTLNVFLTSLSFEYVICGDTNFNLLLKTTDSFKLFHIVKEFGLWQLINGPTFDSKSLLDHFYVNKKSNYTIYGHFPLAGSNHNLTFVIRKINKIKCPARTITYRSYKECDFIKLQSEMNEYVFDKNNFISNEMWRYNNFLLSKLDSYAPLKKRIVKGKSPSWYNSDLNNLRKLRDQAHRLALKSKLPNDMKVFRKYRNDYNNMLHSCKKKYFKTKFTESIQTKPMWNTVHELTNYRQKEKVCISKIRKLNSTITTTKYDEICVVLANEFIVKNDNPQNSLELRTTVNEYCDKYVYDNSTNNLQTISLKEVNDALRNVTKDSKSELFIPLTVIKSCKNVISSQLATFFTMICTTSIIPQCFKSVTVTPLYKGKGPRLNASSYRPISSINIYCKIFERVLYDRLQDKIDLMLCNEQHAYRKGRSCYTALVELTNYLYTAIDKPCGKAIAVYFDAKKAFDGITLWFRSSKTAPKFQSF
jgi:hypothetical protein